MTLTLPPQPPQPVTAEEGRAELVAMWDGLDAEGRRLLLAHARAVVEVTGRGRRVALREAGPPAS